MKHVPVPMFLCVPLYVIEELHEFMISFPKPDLCFRIRKADGNTEGTIRIPGNEE